MKKKIKYVFYYDSFYEYILEVGLVVKDKDSGIALLLIPPKDSEYEVPCLVMARKVNGIYHNLSEESFINLDA